LLQIQARIHLYQEEPEKALHVLNALVKREPENVDARYFLGIALGEAGKPEEALVVYRRLREEDPAFVGACLGEATALLALERIDEAKTALEPLHAYAEQDPMIAMAIGQFYLQIVDLLQTLRYFRLAVQLEPDLTELYPPIIEISMQLGDQAGAQQVLDALRKVDPVLAAQVMVTLMPPVAPTRGRGALGRAVKPVAAMPKETILQLKVTLKGSKPPIWRRILVPADITLATFHDILQTVMGWTDSHLHQFIIDGAYYGVPDREGWGPPVQSEKRAKLNALGLQEKSRFTYEYDFGDSWEHDILVEKLLAPEKGVRYPRCVKGKGACPPEDIGGVWGYEHFLEVMANPKDPEHAEMLEWYGGDFDPTAFTCDDINAMLAPVRKKK
jgi:tetratricopeptide (TPR) repeat protein